MKAGVWLGAATGVGGMGKWVLEWWVGYGGWTGLECEGGVGLLNVWTGECAWFWLWDWGWVEEEDECFVGSCCWLLVLPYEVVRCAAPGCE